VTFAIHPGPIHAAVEDAYRRLEAYRFADALWSRRLDVWSADPAVQQKIANRLGWLESLDFITPHLPRLRAFAASVSSDITDVVLLGMGGSSLAPEVLRTVYGVAPGFPQFRVLDSVDPDAVRAAMANTASSLFVLASKSGSTIEPNVLAAEAERRLRDAGVAQPGSRFVAITDEGTSLHDRARADAFRDIFVNPADIGGRYSALSFFGLVPAALMGIDLDALVSSARAMADDCRMEDPRRNPGLALGALMAAGARSGRDKLTLDLPPHLERFSLWVEQLVAESTGKQGQGVVPIAGEDGNAPISSDRVVVTLDRAHDWGDTPCMTLNVPGDDTLGCEFFRWEVATAAAGFLLGINPFDEPNVQQAKDATRGLLDIYGAQRRLPMPEPDAATEGVRITLSQAARHVTDDPAAFFRLLRPADYFALLAFLPPDNEAFARVLGDIRRDVARRNGCATTLGYGPRYLHSTGQLHKGGPDTGVFLVVTADPSPDLAVPGQGYSFGILEMAQALGDFESLNRAGRRAMHLHLPARDPLLLRRVANALLDAARPG
jgi:glucose-6-phosphate isomerase